jgi:hypothetical protein
MPIMRRASVFAWPETQQPGSPSSQPHRRWLRRTRSKSRAPPPPPELSYAERMRIEALQEYHKRLAEPLALNNDVLINFASCMLAELTMAGAVTPACPITWPYRLSSTEP